MTSGNHLHLLNQKEAVEAVKIMKPKSVIPMHAWGQENLDNFEKILGKELPDMKIIKLEKPGDSFNL